tara:strand:- start:101 stop:1066 length:966 start_codon:yes stop_codon:yes gene_type:complete
MTKIIAELCQNHNGDKFILDEMVHSAKEAGADIIKIQSIDSKELVYRERFENGLIEGGKVKVIKRPFKPEINRLSKLDLSLKTQENFVALCEKYKVDSSITIFSLGKIGIVEKLGFNIIKIASFDCASHRLIEEISKRSFKKIIVSTGVTYNEEIIKTSNILKSAEKNFSLLHCVSIYPTPLEDANLSRINYLKSICKSVGLSDHSNPETTEHILSVMAFTMNIDYLERHFTILKKNETKDGPVSINPDQLKELAQLRNSDESIKIKYVNDRVPDNKLLLGKENRDMSNVELLNRDYYQGRFASKNINGEIVFNWDKNTPF